MWSFRCKTVKMQRNVNLNWRVIVSEGGGSGGPGCWGRPEMVGRVVLDTPSLALVGEGYRTLRRVFLSSRVKDPPSPTCAGAPPPGSPPSSGRTFAWCLLSLSLLLPRVPARGTCGQRHTICLCVSALRTDAGCVLGVSGPHPSRAVTCPFPCPWGCPLVFGVLSDCTYSSDQET